MLFALGFCFVFDTGFVFYVAQAGFELLGSNNPPASVSRVVGLGWQGFKKCRGLSDFVE